MEFRIELEASAARADAYNDAERAAIVRAIERANRSMANRGAS